MGLGLGETLPRCARSGACKAMGGVVPVPVALALHCIGGSSVTLGVGNGFAGNAVGGGSCNSAGRGSELVRWNLGRVGLSTGEGPGETFGGEVEAVAPAMPPAAEGEDDGEPEVVTVGAAVAAVDGTRMGRTGEVADF